MAKGLLLASSSVTTASVASFVLGLVMLLVIAGNIEMWMWCVRKAGYIDFKNLCPSGSSYLKVNPDNVATPIAASLGDLVTLALLAGFSSLFHQSMLGGAPATAAAAASGAPPPPPDLLLGSVVLAGFLVLLPLVATLAEADPQAKQILRTGWTPGGYTLLLHASPPPPHTPIHVTLSSFPYSPGCHGHLQLWRQDS